MSDLAILILNYNTKNLLKSCLESIIQACKPEDIWVIDNASSDNSIRMVKKNFPKVNLIVNSENLGYSRGYNVALRQIDSRLYLLLNSDTLIKSSSIDQLKQCLSLSDYSIISPKLVYPNGKFQPNAGDLPFGVALISWLSGLDDIFRIVGINLPSFHRVDKNYYQKNKGVGWVSGTAMAIKKEVIEKVGLLDEKIFMYAEDVDYCIRARKKGFSIGICSDLEVIHLSGGSLDNPKFNQWMGEFKGLIYLYNKYYGGLAATMVLVFIYFFVSLRMVAFFIIGRNASAQNYGKIIKAL